jgi:hypothetical protein
MSNLRLLYTIPEEGTINKVLLTIRLDEGGVSLIFDEEEIFLPIEELFGVIMVLQDCFKWLGGEQLQLGPVPPQENGRA